MPMKDNSMRDEINAPRVTGTPTKTLHRRDAGMRRGAQENQKQNPASTAKDATGATEKHKQMFERCKDFSFVFLCVRCVLCGGCRFCLLDAKPSATLFWLQT